MDLSLTESQEMLRTAAGEFLQRECSKEVLLDLDRTGTGYTPELWRKVADVGWLGMVIPQQYGGEGASLTDTAILFRELGKAPLPGPYFSSGVLGALLVLEGGTEAQKQELLPAIARGQQILTLAITEPDYQWGPEGVQMRAAPHDGGFLLSGTKLFVYDAVGATHLVCAARTGNGDKASQGITLLLVDKASPGVSVRALPGFLTQLGEVTLDSVEVPDSAALGTLNGGWEVVERATQKAIPVLCAYKVGGCEAILDMSLEYSRSRVQFGTPVGRFQRVQDHIIRLVNHLDAARWTTYEALWKLDTNRPATASVHLAKAVTSEGYYQACNAAHEVHAGTGIVQEYGLTLFTKMSRTLYHYLGDPTYHRRRLAEALEL